MRDEFAVLFLAPDDANVNVTAHGVGPKVRHRHEERGRSAKGIEDKLAGLCMGKVCDEEAVLGRHARAAEVVALLEVIVEQNVPPSDRNLPRKPATRLTVSRAS